MNISCSSGLFKCSERRNDGRKFTVGQAPRLELPCCMTSLRHVDYLARLVVK